MMNDGAWFGMSGMWLYWWGPVLIAGVVILAWSVARRRSRGDR